MREGASLSKREVSWTNALRNHLLIDFCCNVMFGYSLVAIAGSTIAKKFLMGCSSDDVESPPERTTIAPSPLYSHPLLISHPINHNISAPDLIRGFASNDPVT
jgi:hypothetical protein